MKSALILADGEAMTRARLNRLRKNRFFLVLDGAAERAKQEKWRPDLILGDFDSIRPTTRKSFARQGIDFFTAPDQNFTDLEKGIAWCVAQEHKSIWIAQALGKRIDHQLTNLGFLKKFHREGLELKIFSETERVQFCSSGRYQFQGRKNRGFAVLPFAEAVVSSKGLLFEMQKMPLQIGKQESSSNRARTQKIELFIEGDVLVVEEE